jgi:hypothetical protein
MQWVVVMVYRQQLTLDASGSSLSMLEVFFLSEVHWILSIDANETQ